MIFLTVGTYPLPFDRLIIAVDSAITQGLIEEKVFAQIGMCKYRPQNMEYVEMLQKQAFDCRCQRASAIIGHAGMGTITMALDYDKPLLAMPRLKRFGEVVNDHQLAIARRFAQLGHILAVYDVEDLPDGLRRLKHFTPRPRNANPQAVAQRIHDFLDNLNGSRPGPDFKG